MDEINLWVEWRVQEGSIERFEQLIREICACVEKEEPDALSFWGYRGEDGTTFHLYESFRNLQAATDHLSGKIGPVSTFVPQQLKIAELVRIELHSTLDRDQVEQLKGDFPMIMYSTLSGFKR